MWSSLQRIDAQLEGTKAASFAALGFIVPFFALLNWLSFRESIPVPREQLLLTVAVVPSLNAVMYVVLRPLLRLRCGKWSPLWLLAWYVAVNAPAEVIKVLMLGLFTEHAEYTPRPIPVLVSAVVIAVGTFMIANLASNWVIEVRRTVGRLNAVQTALIQARNQASQRLSSELMALREQVENSLIPTIDSLANRLADESTASEIRDLCEGELRDLGRQITQAEPTLAAAQASARSSLFHVARSVFRLGQVSPNQLMIAISVIGITFAFNNAGWAAAALAIIGLSCGYLLVIAIDPWRRRTFGAEGWPSFISALTMYFSIAVVGAKLVNWGLPLYPELWDFIDTLEWLLPGFLVLLWFILASAGGAKRALNEAVELFLIENAKLESTNRQLLARSRQARESLYRLVHGSVQGRLAAVSMALNVSADGPNFQEVRAQAAEQMEAARRDLIDAFAGRPSADAEGGFRRRLESIAMAWRNLIAIQVSIDEQEFDLIESFGEPLVSDLTASVQEAITNAHRHSRASRIHVGVEVSSDSVDLIATNDRSAPAPIAVGSGSGLQELEKSGAKVTLSHHDNATTLRVSWPRA